MASRGAAAGGAALTAAAVRLKAHVSFLADDLLEGREAGSRGHEIAARYVATQFEMAGATPGAEGGRWLQPIELHETRLTGPAQIRLDLPIGQRTLEHGGDVLVDSGVNGGDIAVEGPLVFVGYGVVDSTLGIDDYAGLDVRGKIVVALAGPAPGMDSEIAAHLSAQSGRAARERGAAGGLLIPSRARSRARPWELEVRFRRDEETTTTWVTRAGTPDISTRGPGIGALIRSEAAAALFEGSPRSLEAVLDEADRPGGRPRGFELAGRARLTMTATARRYSTPAVMGIVTGSDPALRGEFVALTAHADHVGVKTTGEGDRINNGALDNAIGTAMLIEVARALSADGARPGRSVLLIAHTAEEKGLLGAYALMEHLPVPASQLVGAVNLDMPVLLHDFTDVVAFGSTHSTMAQVIARAAAAEGLALAPDPMPEQAIFTRSDHYAMVKAGIPAVMLMPGMANGGQAALLSFIGKHYHQPTDDITLPIDWPAAARFARLNEVIVRALATGSRVRWYEGDYFGQTFAKGAPAAPRTTPAK